MAANDSPPCHPKLWLCTAPVFPLTSPPRLVSILEYVYYKSLSPSADGRLSVRRAEPGQVHPAGGAGHPGRRPDARVPHLSKTQLIFVGGFLGAGKTTLLAQAAGELVRRGRRVGLITNDQAGDLVDTALLQDSGFSTHEVTGGCFCCKIEDLIATASEIVAKHRPDVIIGEPVGSCTDLAATVVRPLGKLHADMFQVAPLSVLVDPERLGQLLGLSPSPLPPSVIHIFRTQLEEADLIVINKTDRLAPSQLQQLRDRLASEFPGRPVMTLSAQCGTGVGAWLDRVTAEGPAGLREGRVDYATYTEGEAQLGWFNGTLELSSREPRQWQSVITLLLQELGRDLGDRKAEIAHVKVLASAAGAVAVGNLVTCAAPPTVRGSVDATTTTAQMIVNARVRLDAATLRKAVQDAVEGVCAALGLAAKWNKVEAFEPAPPKPVYRMGVEE